MRGPVIPQEVPPKTVLDLARYHLAGIFILSRKPKAGTQGMFTLIVTAKERTLEESVAAARDEESGLAMAPAMCAFTAGLRRSARRGRFFVQPGGKR